MSNPNSQNNLTLTFTQLDASLVNILGSSGRTVGPVTFAGAVGVWTEGLIVGVSPVSVGLPTTLVLQLYVKNLHATAKLTVTWTPQGGASAITQVVSPGGMIAFWNTATNAASGVTALTLQSDTANTPVEMFLGG